MIKHILLIIGLGLIIGGCSQTPEDKDYTKTYYLKLNPPEYIKCDLKDKDKNMWTFACYDGKDHILDVSKESRMQITNKIQ